MAAVTVGIPQVSIGKSRTALVRMACALGVVLAVLAFGASQAHATTFTPLTLQNGWTNAPFSTRDAAVANVSGIVQFEGAIATSGTNAVAFTLPSGFRPATLVYVPVDMCDATNGRLIIEPTGVVTVQPEGPFSDASCFTSLEGASFPLNASGFTALTLQNGWTNAPFSTRNARAKTIGGIVHLEGAVGTTSSNDNSQPFTLPSAFRPSTTVYVKVDLCDATNGRLEIEPSGAVFIQVETVFSNAQCFTSLEGVSFALNASGFTALGVKNGWTNAPFGTRSAAAQTIGGVVHLEGAIATPTSNPEPITLPAAFRPLTAVYVPVDLCNATNGRLFIHPNGNIIVQAEGGKFSNAKCFTSLEGANFAK